MTFYTTILSPNVIPDVDTDLNTNSVHFMYSSNGTAKQLVCF